jgi:hypothetical protein
MYILVNELQKYKLLQIRQKHLKKYSLIINYGDISGCYMMMMLLLLLINTCNRLLVCKVDVKLRNAMSGTVLSPIFYIMGLMQGSILSTFYACIFHTKVLRAAFL